MKLRKKLEEIITRRVGVGFLLSATLPTTVRSFAVDLFVAREFDSEDARYISEGCKRFISSFISNDDEWDIKDQA